MSDNANGGGGGGRLLNDRYQLINVVGGGGMAIVYRARDNVLGRIVAVKVLREQYANDTQFVARFRREAQAAANLAHPNIVNVYDVGQDGDVYYIVMEHISGQSLKELITRTSPLPVEKAATFAAQILAGLEYAHRSGLIHRDIKPQNVLITSEGAVKVTDFGIAKSVSDLGLTEAGMALGTAHYFSPEQAKGERVVPQSDIYAVGVTLYEMLAGQLPFESDSAVGLAYKHISEEARPLRDLNPNIPVRLENIVRKALAKDPNERFGSAAEMEKALRSMMAGGQQATMEVPVAYPAVTQAGTRPVTRAQNRPVRSALPGSPPPPVTGSLRTSRIPRGPVPATGTLGSFTGSGAGTAARQMTSPLGAPASVAIRPSAVKVQAGSGGCSTAAIIFVLLGLLGAIVGGGLLFAPQINNLFSDPVVPSPTPTPVTPTVTPTLTPTNTPTVTPTSTSTPTSTPQSTRVPLFVGLKLRDAEVLAKQSGLVLVELERIISPDYPEGVVAQQDPRENTVIKQTSQIAVRVSNGPPPFKMPQLANTDPEAARVTLESTGLRVQTALEGSDTIPKGVVIRSEPQADSSVRAGDAVTLVISRGEVSTVPDLVGIENADLARIRLEQAGLQLGEVIEIDDPGGTVPPGAVLRQNPPRGTVLERGSPVNIELRRRE